MLMIGIVYDATFITFFNYKKLIYFKVYVTIDYHDNNRYSAEGESSPPMTPVQLAPHKRGRAGVGPPD